MDTPANMPAGEFVAAIALNRFGLGARAGDKVDDWKAWLTAQITSYDPKPVAIRSTPTSLQVAGDNAKLRAVVDGSGNGGERQAARMELYRIYRELYRDAVSARFSSAIESITPFAERLVHFWANHFAISADKPDVTPFAGAFELEAIRPHVMGRFEDMLLAVERHAGMMIYLDQERSVGPNSELARRARNANRPRIPGLNENLAREILELHTLGVRTGYTQDDVTEFARALTGWSVAGFGLQAVGSGKPMPGTFVFRPELHEPGQRTILGKVYAQPGEAQARAVLADLASAPATAKHVAVKLARHFGGDDPPPVLVSRLEQAFLASGGDLPAVYRALIDSPEIWALGTTKFKTPWEWMVSMLRGTGGRGNSRLPLQQLAAQLGQPVWQPKSPAGWDDLAATWAAPNALTTRVEAASRLARVVPESADVRQLAEVVLQGRISPGTRRVIESADTRENAIALLFVSPEFQRR